MAGIKFIKNDSLKEKPADTGKLGFGKIFSDYMFTYKFSAEKGWHDAKIEPYAPFAMSPSTSCLHYGQAIFEGMKAYKNEQGEVRLFRPKDNFARMNRSAKRLCMEPLLEEDLYEALVQLVKTEKDWIPTDEGTSLYIRPTYIATEQALGVHASKDYLFFVILSPSGAYYAQGLKPIKIYVEDEYVRAVVGGVGYTKAAGNYAASILAGDIAAKKGFTQVLWLDGIEHKYAEEVGAMNMFFIIGDEIITPPLAGSILPGITRDSIITLAKDMGYNVSERKISIDEISAAAKAGTLKEAFGTGTAAVVSPVGELFHDGAPIVINGGVMGEITTKLYDTLTGIQYGRISDKYGWTVVL